MTRKRHVRVPQEMTIAAARQRGGIATLEQLAEDQDISITTAERHAEGYVAQGRMIRDDHDDAGRPVPRLERRYGLAEGEHLELAPIGGTLPLPRAWQDPDPTCPSCSRTLQRHKGWWTCVARGCGRYGDAITQDDNGKEQS